VRLYEKISVTIGLLVIVLAGVLGYTYLKNQQASQRVIIGKDVSAVHPGLGLRALHEQGYTGKGVNVAIIDGPLLVDHEEFSGRLVHFEKVGVVNETDLYHGTTVASVLVGNRCGVVPAANLHFLLPALWMRIMSWQP
jgi:subtilisin family serine protease